jgi:hypothetical protein
MFNQSAFRLPFNFIEQRLLDDLAVCMKDAWPQHFNQHDFEGDWSSIALRSASGNATDIVSHPGTQYFDTPLLERCPCFRELISRFHCPLETVRLLRLAPGSIIKEHRDMGASYMDGVLRIHVPVTTNPGVIFIVGGETIRMLPGECWYADFSLPHSVRNDGSSSRVHLVIDALRNSWTDEVFTQAGYDLEAERNAKRPSKETHQRIIEELSRQDSPAAQELLQTLLAEDEHQE